MLLTRLVFLKQSLLVATLPVEWWLAVIVLLAALLLICCYHYFMVQQFKNIKADFFRQLHDRNELVARAERSEENAKNAADMAINSRGELLTKISHEVRTPLNAMMGMASLLNETMQDGEQQEYTGTIVKSGESMLALINEVLLNDVLEFSKAEAGKQLYPCKFNLTSAVEDVLDVFAVKVTQKPKLELLYYIDDTIPAQVAADNHRLRQVLMNLVENAVNHTEEGEVFIGLHLLERDDNNRIKLEFEISDTGSGMVTEKAAQLLRDISQNGVDNNEICGLGLTVCKKIVQMMGGTMYFKSEEGHGTDFRFTMWADVVQQDNELRDKLPQQMINEGVKALIVDENKTAAFCLKKRLERWGVKVLTAENGKRALELLEQDETVDIVLTSKNMAIMSGIEMARWMRQYGPSLPIILLNKTGDESYMQHSGLFTAVINKPVRQHILASQLIAALRHKNEMLVRTINKQKLSVDFARKNPLRILVAEDNTVNQLLVAKILNKLGYQPHISNNGKEVLEEVKHNHYDLILMDVQMPEMDGLEATQMIRLCVSTQPIIIAMTANSLQGDREACLKAGMDDYLSKPVKLDELVNVLEKWAIQIRAMH